MIHAGLIRIRLRGKSEAGARIEIPQIQHKPIRLRIAGSPIRPHPGLDRE